MKEYFQVKSKEDLLDDDQEVCVEKKKAFKDTWFGRHWKKFAVGALALATFGTGVAVGRKTSKSDDDEVDYLPDFNDDPEYQALIDAENEAEEAE